MLDAKLEFVSRYASVGRLKSVSLPIQDLRCGVTEKPYIYSLYDGTHFKSKDQALPHPA